MRKTIIAGNWKLNGTIAEAEALLGALETAFASRPDVQIVVCPPYTKLAYAAQKLAGSNAKVGGQDLFWKEKGAYTAQISAPMLKETGCTYVIVGHSERRGRFGVPEPDFSAAVLAYFGDSDITVNLKLKAALAGGLIPICCVGETLAERQSGSTDSVVSSQTTAALQGVTEGQVASLVFAYEPVWAIGTGEVCAAEEADRVCGVIRQTVGKLYASEIAEIVQIQYGGSVKPDNAADLLGRPNIDGALVGGASLKAADFAAIVAAAG